MRASRNTTQWKEVVEGCKAQYFYTDEHLSFSTGGTRPPVMSHNGGITLIVIENLGNGLHMQLERQKRCLKRLITQWMFYPIDGKTLHN